MTKQTTKQVTADVTPNQTAKTFNFKRAGVEVSLVLELDEPVKFEGKTYNDIDLSGLLDLKPTDFQNAQRIFEAQGGIATADIELDMGFTLLIASIATNLPIEFFNNLKLPIAMWVKQVVARFLLSMV
jgi:hypothetical protein